MSDQPVARTEAEILEDLYAKRDAFALRKQDAIAAAIPPEIKELLDTIKGKTCKHLL